MLAIRPSIILVLIVQFAYLHAESCNLEKCSRLRQAAELSFNEEVALFCRSLQNYLVCLRTLSVSCVHDNHVKQVLSRYSESCQNIAASRNNDPQVSYFVTKKSRKSKKAKKAKKTDDLYDDLAERKKLKSKVDDKFDDLGERLTKNKRKNKNKKGKRRSKKGDLYDDIGEKSKNQIINEYIDNGRHRKSSRSNNQPKGTGRRHDMFNGEHFGRMMSGKFYDDQFDDIDENGKRYVDNRREKSRFQWQNSHMYHGIPLPRAVEHDDHDDFHMPFTRASEVDHENFEFDENRDSSNNYYMSEDIYDSNDMFEHGTSSSSEESEEIEYNKGHNRLLNDDEIEFEQSDIDLFKSNIRGRGINRWSDATGSYFDDVPELSDNFYDEIQADADNLELFDNNFENDGMDDFMEDVRKRHVLNDRRYSARSDKTQKRKYQNIRNSYFDSSNEDWSDVMPDSSDEYLRDGDDFYEETSTDEQYLGKQFIPYTTNKRGTVLNSKRPKVKKQNDLPNHIDFLSKKVPLSKKLGIKLDQSQMRTSEGVNLPVKKQKILKDLVRTSDQLSSQNLWLYQDGTSMERLKQDNVSSNSSQQLPALLLLIVLSLTSMLMF